MSEFASYTANGSKKVTTNGSRSNGGNAWGSEENPAAFDFRSDVHTTPTASMLKAIQECTLLDDVTMEDPTTLSLERFIADLSGKEDALLVLSGTMGNQVALRAHLTVPPHAVLCDRRGHILNYEAGGVATLSQAMMQPIDAKNNTYITLEEVQKYAVVSDDIHACPTRVISLENTLNGAVMPLSEVRRISAWAREHGIIMHLDGARLWEAVAAGAGTLKEYCAEFDSISLCFSKGLGAPIGSIVVGTEAFIKRSRWIRKSIGGGLRQAGVVAAPARVAVEETFLGGKLTQSHENAKNIQKIWTDLGGKLQYPVDTNMVWLDLEGHNIDTNDFIELAEKYGLRVRAGRFVVHYQIGEEAIERLRKLFTEVLTGKESNGKKAEAPHDPEDLKMKGKGVE
ncbi:Nn.00g054090.m01.CDS01 [Neocucurbitaria sp. VM-36]